MVEISVPLGLSQDEIAYWLRRYSQVAFLGDDKAREFADRSLQMAQELVTFESNEGEPA